MASLASRILRGRLAHTLAVNAELLGSHQGRLIVRLRHEPTVGVFDQLRGELVLFDGAALVALASAEGIAAELDASVAADVMPMGAPTGSHAVIDPPSRL